MVESRWLRWIGPGVVALGAVGFIASTTRGRGRPAVGAERPARVPGATWSRLHATASPQPISGTARSAPGFAWIRCSTAVGPARPAPGDRARWGPADRPHAGSPARVVRRRAVRPVVLVGSDDGTTSRLAAIDVAERLRLADRRGARRHPPRDDRSGRDVDHTRCASIASAARTSASGGGHRWPGRRPSGTSSTAFRRTHASGARGRPSSAGTMAGDRLAIQSCGEVSCRIRVISPGRRPRSTTLDAPDLGTLVGSTGTRRDLRGVPRAPLPDRRRRICGTRRSAQLLADAAGRPP